MTIAIGTYFRHTATPSRYSGFILCADTKIVASDGVTTYGKKLELVIKGYGRSECFAIANAAEDGNAANSLAMTILQALCDRTPSPLMPAHDKQVKEVVQQTMTEWHKGYTQSLPPSVQFILGVASEFQHTLYFCEPPNTVLRKWNYETPITIGMGGRAIDPLLDTVITDQCDAKQTLMRLAYLMYRAKKDQARDCGGETDALVVVQSGDHPLPVSRKEMSCAEAVGPHLDAIIRQCFSGLLAQKDNANQIDLIQKISQWYVAENSIIAGVEFKSLDRIGILVSHGPW